MKHYLKKNLTNIQGAGGGGGGGGGGGPPPAELKPPQLGKLQTLASYSYSEIIDLVSDGPIEGLVNQNGQYVQGNRIFEGIYFDNTPIKKSFDLSYTGESAVSASGYSFSPTSSALYQKWFTNDTFLETPFTGTTLMQATGALVDNITSGYNPFVVKEGSYFANHSQVNDPFVSLAYAPITYTGNSGNLFTCPDPYSRERYAEITWKRDDIAKSIYKGIDLLKEVSSSPSSYGESAAAIAAQKLLRFNYQNWTDVKDNVLPYYLNESNDDYPIFAVKLEIGSPYAETYTKCGHPIIYFNSNDKEVSVSSDFEVNKDTNIILKDDIANQVFEKIEIEEIGSARPIRPLQYLDFTYAQKTTSTNISLGGSVIVFGFKDGRETPTEESIRAIYECVKYLFIVRPDNEKYNYSNVLCEARTGDDLQSPLGYFNKVYIDKLYGIKLVGPFDVSKQVLRVSNFDDDTGYNIRGVQEFPLVGAADTEGSSDQRQSKDFSSYAGNSKLQYVEEAVPITHIIENPNVDQVFLSIGVRALSDTVQVDSTLPGLGSVTAGSRVPSVVRFKLEIGLQDAFGKDVSSSIEERIYQIVGLADSAALIDLGREEVSSVINNYKFLQGTRGTNEVNAASEILLPPATIDSKRFIRLTRTTYETSSVLIRREISLEKVTEVIDAKFSYPGSAIVGTKIDSRNISSIPPRSFDLRLKRVLVPSNYYPLAPDGKDKRRYKTSTEFEAATAESLQIYKGNWDGTFKEAWTDNPAWVLFDMLVDYSYGLGSFIDASQVNIWELYKIGRFCDAVDRNGAFVGVDNTYGGKEPRYAINVIMADKISVFDAINAISSVFRGNVFYANSYIDFTDDRLKIPLAEFSNANVKDGTFSYTNSRKDEEFNVVEVSYLDENDSFKPKIEYVENSDDIRKRGILRTTIDSFGVTSKAMAQRIGKHVLYATTNENQAVSFVGGLETLYLKPGDLINVNDELKTLQRNFGRVLDIDPELGKVWINEKFNENYFLGEITLFAPTGKSSYDDLLRIARTRGGLAFKDIHESDVPQIQSFQISGYDNGIDYGSHVYIQPKTVYPIIRFTGESFSGSGLYSGVGSLNDFPLYSGVGPTTSGFSIQRKTESVYQFIPGTPASSPDPLYLSFNAIESGSVGLTINGNSYDVVFDTDSDATYFVNIESMTTEDELAQGIADALPVISYVSYGVDGNTMTITNGNLGSSASTILNFSTMNNMDANGGGNGVDGIPDESGFYPSVNPFWTLEYNNSSLTSGSSGEIFPYIGSWQSGTCFDAAVTGSPNRDFLDRVSKSSPFGITMSGMDKEIYKVTSIKESNVNEYEVAAIKFNTGKFAEIESSQNLDDFYSVFSSLPQQTSQGVVVDSISYNLDSPTILGFNTGVFDGQDDGLDISGSWTQVNGASAYAVSMIAPNGQKTSLDLTGLNYIFEDQNQLGFYRLTVSAKNSSLGYTSATVSSGVSIYSTASFSTPYIKNISIN